MVLRRLAFSSVILASCLTVGCGRGDARNSRDDCTAVIMAGKVKESLDLLKAASEKNPKDGAILMWLGLSQSQNNQPEDAIQSFEKAAQLLPAYSEPLEFEGAVEMQKGRWSRADAVLSRALARSQKNPRILTALAVAKLGLNNPATSKLYLDQALKINPSYAPALYNLGWLNEKWLKRKDEAHRNFDQYLGVADDPVRTDAVRRILGESKQRDRDRRSATDETSKGISCYRRGDISQALDCFKRAIGHDDSYDVAYYNLGLAHQSLKDYDSAISAFTQALRIKPDKKDARYALALSFWKKSDLINATTALKTLIQCDPDYAKAHLLLGQIYSLDPGKVELTQKHYGRYLELQPDGAEAADARKWVNSHKGPTALWR